MGEFTNKYQANTKDVVGGNSTGVQNKRIAKSINIPTRTINRWARLTDDNYHSEVRRDIAKYFAKSDESFKPLADELSAIVKEHYRIGYMPQELYDRRGSVTDKMLERIKSEYGEETYRKVIKGL